jgi:hypothetical protein
MPQIHTWKELLESDLPLRGDDVSYDSLYKEFAIIAKPNDDLLRLDYGLIIMSVIHPVKDPLAADAEQMLVVMEAPLVETVEDGAYTAKPYVPVQGVIAHYRTADNLGLVGNHADPNVHSVLVPTDKLDQIRFTYTPVPLKQWEVDILSGN